MEKFAVTDYKLCYVRDGLAYFTTQSLSNQWGDDWNDAPYEHNAGEPYTYRADYDGKQGRSEWDILTIAFRSGMETPAQLATNGNSPYSVEDINKGCVAWLRPDRWTTNEGNPIVAGVNPLEFIRIMNENGGEIYLPSTRLELFK